jgi:hypothetical protein
MQCKSTHQVLELTTKYEANTYVGLPPTVNITSVEIEKIACVDIMMRWLSMVCMYRSRANYFALLCNNKVKNWRISFVWARKLVGSRIILYWNKILQKLFMHAFEERWLSTTLNGAEACMNFTKSGVSATFFKPKKFYWNRQEVWLTGNCSKSVCATKGAVS